MGLEQLFTSIYFVSFFIAWLTACIMKIITRSVVEGNELSLLDGFTNGGMPSTHSAAVSSITIMIGLTTGYSPIFFVSLVLSLIVISDSFGLRRNVGLQGQAVNELRKKAKEDPIRIVYGHSFVQTLAGIVWGGAVSYLLYAIY